MTTEQTVTLILAMIVAVVMIILGAKDHNSFKRDQHVDYKSIIVSLGILGTFSGMILGLWHFNTQDIFSSVPRLLEGLKLAFLTSIFGIAVSVFLSVLQAQPEKKSDTDTVMRDIKQQLETANQKLDTSNQALAVILDNGTVMRDIKQLLETANQALGVIVDDVKQFKTTYQRYQRQQRFILLSSDGQTLPETATQWAAVQDNETGLIWEVKTNDGGLQDSQHTYTWYDPEGDRVGKENGGRCQGCRCDTAAYLKSINEIQLAGSNHWRVPSIAELETLLKDKAAFDKRYFPHIQPDWYCSATPHSSDDKQFWCFYVETGLRGHNKYGYGHLMLVTSTTD